MTYRARKSHYFSSGIKNSCGDINRSFLACIYLNVYINKLIPSQFRQKAGHRLAQLISESRQKLQKMCKIINFQLQKFHSSSAVTSRMACGDPGLPTERLL